MEEKAQSSPTLDLPWIAVPLAMVGAFLLWEGLSKSVPYSALHGTIILAVGIAVWFQQPWARLAGALYFALVAGGKLYQQYTSDFTAPQMLAVGGCLSLCWALWHWTDLPRHGPKRPLVSIVLLLRQPRFLSNTAVARATTVAWGEQFVAGDADQKGNIIAGESPLFLVRTAKASYLVHNQNQSYFDNVKDDLAQITELRVRNAVAEHAGWIAVDLLDGSKRFKTQAEAYPLIGRLVAELTGPDCVAVLCPETGFVCVFDDTVDEKLRSADPLKALQETEHVPVIGVPVDDPRMTAAVAEARQRWPEFLKAFGQRQPGETFAVKAPITSNGHTEFIWLQVTNLDDELIHGHLDNDPVNLPVKCGDAVTVPIKDLNDWAFTRGETTTGLFTLKVIQQVTEETPVPNPSGQA